MECELKHIQLKRNVFDNTLSLSSIKRNRDSKLFYSKLRDELLNREIFDTLLEVWVLLERWRREYN